MSYGIEIDIIGLKQQFVSVLKTGVLSFDFTVMIYINPNSAKRISIWYEFLNSCTFPLVINASLI